MSIDSTRDLRAELLQMGLEDGTLGPATKSGKSMGNLWEIYGKSVGNL